MLAAQQPIDMPRLLIEALTITHSRKIGLIAVTIHLTSPPIVAPGLSASDIVAICSLVVAALALGFSIVAAETQRRHNIRMARPHMDIDRGLQTFLLRITNQGPGIARLQVLTVKVDDLTFNLLKESGVDAFCNWISEGMQVQGIEMERNMLSVGSSFAPNLTIELIVIATILNEHDKDLLEMKLKSIAFDLSYASIFDKVYSEEVEPFL